MKRNAMWKRAIGASAIVALSVVGTSACGKKKSKGTTGDGSGDVYVPSNTPANKLSLTLPSSLVKADGSSALRLNGDMGDMGGSDQGVSQSNGFSQMQGFTTNLVGQLMFMSRDLMMIDKAWDDIAEICGFDLKLVKADCNVGEIKVEFTDDLRNGTVDALGGEDTLPADQVEFLDAEVGSELTISDLVFAAGEDPYTTKVTGTFKGPHGDFNNVYQWNDDFTKIATTAAFTQTFDAEEMAKMGEMEGSSDMAESGGMSVSGTYGLALDTELELFDAAYTFETAMGDSVEKGTSRARIQRDKDSEDDTAVVFSFNDDISSSTFGSFAMTGTGVANSDGGRMETKYTMETVTISGATTSGATTAGESYQISAASVTAGEMNTSVALGSLSGDGTTTPDVSGIAWWGPPAGGSGLKLWSFSWSESYEEVFVDSGLTLTLSASTTKTPSYFDEQWDAAGELLAWCVKDTPGGSCVSGEGDFSADFEVGAIAFEGVSKYTLGGSSPTSLGFETLYFFPGSLDVSEVPPTGGQWQGFILAYGFFGGDPDSPSSDMADYGVDYVGDEGQASAAKAYTMGFDDSGLPAWILKSAVTIQKQ